MTIEDIKNKIPQSVKNGYHLVNAMLANFWFGFPSRKLKVIGVTGTNGKTTTVQMIGRILEEAGYKVAISSTINFKLGKKQWANKTKLTTLSAWSVQNFISDAVNAGCEYLVLEVSSHSLDQNRVRDIEFDVAVITNVTREHLDYHETMEKYRAAKMKLFRMFKDGSGVAIVNLGMEKPHEFLQIAKKAEKNVYSLEEIKENDNKDLKAVYAEGILLGQKKSSFSVRGTYFTIGLVGEFNVENALAAISVGLSQGIDLEIMALGLGKMKKVPGRMDYVENERGIDIVIDYALTPDSMEKLGQVFEKQKANSEGGKLIWVFGSCGQRDRGKRPIMGKIVAKFADIAIVTNEDPYNEDPQRIIDEVFVGVLDGGAVENENAFRIFNRKEAIKKALESAQIGDVVLVTGKGAEETMAVGQQRLPWSDREVIKNLLSVPKK
ncbi:MAG: UDP-N-acetylmuramoyl-L-alanyl-D-glutamate--2,6-diaminopimelate ligase [Patescibacteria group bacterium]|nr:UDP-N-acetylmuramoyl-L-alanyl-D-glutamate--2,6-diaminopimelate ligase [Patescibacteria group bacterium]